MQQHPDKRNYNLVFVLITGVLGILCFGLTISGQTAIYLAELPASDLSLMRKVKNDEIIYVDLEEANTAVSLPQTGDYEIISTSRKLSPSILTIQAIDTKNPVITIVDRTKQGNYDSSRLQGRILFKFSIEEPGIYEIQVQNLDLDQNDISVTIFPDYDNVNRNRILIPTSVLFVLLIAFFIYRRRPVLSKKERRVKQNKWESFIDDK